MDELPHVHEFAQFGGGRRRRDIANHLQRFGGRQVVTDRTNTANAFGERRYFREMAAFAELLETAKFDNMETHGIDRTLLVEMQRDATVAFD